MKIKELKLVNFRVYQKKIFNFDNQTAVLVGPNAVGKTNILEAIYLLATGESFRADKIEEMVRWGEEVAHIEGSVTPELRAANSSGVEYTQLRVTLTRGEVQGRRVQKRSYKVNGVARRKQDFVGKMTAVSFRPEDLDLITKSPGGRRKFLDRILMQVDVEYRRSLNSYEKGLKRRNKLLDMIREGQVARTVLAFWDQLLIKEGSLLTNKRRELIEYINAQPKLEDRLMLTYEFSAISETRLKQYSDAEIAFGYTLVGPHKDDFKVVVKESNFQYQIPNENGVDLSKYGSRGQQRMAVFWLKLCELAFIESRSGERPVLLLDDIFSELDNKHDQLVMKLLGKQQTIITATELDERFDGQDLQIERVE